MREPGDPRHLDPRRQLDLVSRHSRARDDPREPGIDAVLVKGLFELGCRRLEHSPVMPAGSGDGKQVERGWRIPLTLRLARTGPGVMLPLFAVRRLGRRRLGLSLFRRSRDACPSLRRCGTGHHRPGAPACSDAAGSAHERRHAGANGEPHIPDRGLRRKQCADAGEREQDHKSSPESDETPQRERDQGANCPAALDHLVDASREGNGPGHQVEQRHGADKEREQANCHAAVVGPGHRADHRNANDKPRTTGKK